MERPKDDVDKALIAIEAGQYATAVLMLEPLVAQGDPKATANMALLYSFGWGVAPDPRKAAEMYESVGKLAIREQHISALAYRNLATLYIVGPPGLPPDSEKAARFECMAKELGFPG